MWGMSAKRQRERERVGVVKERECVSMRVWCEREEANITLAPGNGPGGAGSWVSGSGVQGRVEWIRGGLVFEAHRLCVSLNSRRESNKQEHDEDFFQAPRIAVCTLSPTPNLPPLTHLPPA